MGKNTNLFIRAAIDHALELETETRSLELYVATRLPVLHQSIKLPEDAKQDTLVGFLNRYVEHVPEFLDALIDISTNAGVYNSVEKIVFLAQSYFKNPPDFVNDHKGLLALVDEAYLAHRLMEEASDRILMDCGFPLLPMDMALSNVVVHALLGEEFANQLDMAVHYSMETLFEEPSLLDNPKLKIYLAMQHSEGWEKTLQKWPCLAGDTSILLDLEQQKRSNGLH